jgi:hypothetical protein
MEVYDAAAKAPLVHQLEFGMDAFGAETAIRTGTHRPRGD